MAYPYLSCYMTMPKLGFFIIVEGKKNVMEIFVTKMVKKL